MYIQRFKDGTIESYDIINDMMEFYRENKVIVLGHFINKNEPNETILLTVYKNKSHYNNFVKKMKNEPIYIKRQKYLEERRISFKSRELELNRNSRIQPSEEDLYEYIDDVKLLLDGFMS